MSGSVALGAAGSGYIITDTKEPDVTVVVYLGMSHVCVRETPEWKKIVAEFCSEEHAGMFARSLRSSLRAGHR